MTKRPVMRRFLPGAALLCLNILTGPLTAQEPSSGSSNSPLPAFQSDDPGQHIPRHVTQGLLIKKVNPKYPAELRRKHVQGTVILRAEIGTDGSIHNLIVVSGEPSLVKAALKAVKQWKYKPYIVDGKPTAVETEIQVNFALDQG